MSRGVVLIGIPYPHGKNPEIHFKKLYNDREVQKLKLEHQKTEKLNEMKSHFYLNGKEWYSQQAFRALNQALGRCIRHRYDYGCVIFLESRFCGNSNFVKQNQSNLSKWIRPCIRESKNVKYAVTKYIKPFFDSITKKPPKFYPNTMEKWKGPFPMPENIWTKNNHLNFNQLMQSQSHNHRNRNRLNNHKKHLTQSAPNTRRTNNHNYNNKHRVSTQIPSHNNNNNNNNNKNNNNGLTQFQQKQFTNYYHSPKPNITPTNGSNSNPQITQIQTTKPAQSCTPQTPYDINNTRKRKFEEIQNENVNINNTNKRLKVNNHHNKFNNNNQTIKQPPITNIGHQTPTGMDYQNENENENDPAVTANCAQCNCGVMICNGTFKSIELSGGGKKMIFYSTEQEFPCDTANNCIWSSQLKLCFMYKKCNACGKSVGFHVVGASSQKELQYYKHILLLPSIVKLLTFK